MKVSFIIFLLIGVITLGISQNIPYRNDSTYKLELKMEFKTPEPADVNQVKPGQVFRNNPGVELYVNVKLKLLLLIEGDYKLKVVNNNGQAVLTTKLKKPDDYLIKLGRVKDVKERKTANLYIAQFYNKEKKLRSRITIEIKENGDFMVNNKLFGKI